MDLSEINPASKRRHPWEIVRAEFFASILGRSEPAPVRCLDVGSGDAWIAGELARAHPTWKFVCWDSGYGDSLAAAPRRADPAGAFSFTARPPEEAFDLVLLLDVLEHVEEEAAFLTKIVERNVAPGGRVLVSVPAWPFLFSAHDLRLRHHRRYLPRQLRELVASAGLRMLCGGGLFASLLVARTLQKALGIPLAGAGDWTCGPVASRSAQWLLRADCYGLRALQRWRIPGWGLSVWALCQK